MSSSKLSLIDRAEHGDADAILKLLAPKQGLSWKRRKYWTWQLISTLDVPISEKIPEGVLLDVLWDAANLKRKGFLDKDDEKQFPKWVEAYKKLHLGRAYWVLYVNTSDNKLEREYLTAGCKAKSRRCSAVLASMLSRNGDFLKATDLYFEACTWPVDKLLDRDEDSDDSILKQKGCKCIMDHLSHNEVGIDKSKPLLIKVYENGDDEQKKKSAEELEKRTLDFLKPLFSKVESYAQQGLYKEAADLCAKLLSKKDELTRQLPKHDKIDKLFAPLASAREKYLASMLKPGIYIALALLLGFLGAHDFYAGSPKKAKCKILLSLLSLGYLAPVSWLLSFFQLFALDANLNRSVQQRKGAKHTKSSIIKCIILYVIILAIAGHYMKGESKDAESTPSAPIHTTQQGTTTPLTLGGTPNVSASTSGMMKLPTAEDIVLPFETPEPSALTSTPVSAKSPTEQLQEAVKEGDAQKVKSLMEQGADANTYRDDKGKTLLHLAVDAESLETVQALLKGKADPNARNNEGRTPIYSAIYRQNEAIIKALLDGGAKTKVDDKWKITPLEFAKERRCKPSIITLLKNNKK